MVSCLGSFLSGMDMLTKWVSRHHEECLERPTYSGTLEDCVDEATVMLVELKERSCERDSVFQSSTSTSLDHQGVPFCWDTRAQHKSRKSTLRLDIAQEPSTRAQHKSSAQDASARALNT